MEAHPSEAQLRQWLDGSLGESESARIEAHIEICPEVCQRALERLPAGATAPTRDVRLSRAGRLESADQAPTAASQASLATPTGTPRCPAGYTFVATLGRGGMGAVVRAREIALHRDVAIKFVEPRFGQSDTRFVTRFRLEAEAMARLRHPNIMPVYAVGADAGDAASAAGRPFLVMEYAEGGSLADRLRGRDPVTPRQAAAVCEVLARAAHHAHDRGVIHRDLKPSNILLSAPPETAAVSEPAKLPPGTVRIGDDIWTPKLADFGLVKLDDAAGGDPAAREAQTLTGEVWGSPGFMSPEQARGDTSAVGVRSDVHALGAILYYLLVGKSPFDAPTTAQVIERVKSATPEPPRRLRPAIPADLELICLKALQKDPADRYASAADLADDLRRFAEGRPIAARPFGPAERAWRWAKRNRALAATLVGLMVTMIAGTAVSLRYAFRAESNADDARAQSASAQSARQVAESQTRLAEVRAAEASEQSRQRQALLERSEWREYAALLAQAKVALDAGQSAAAAAALDRCRFDLRGWEHRYLMERLRGDGSCQAWPSGGGRTAATAYSGDGRFYALATNNSFSGDAMTVYRADGTFVSVIVRESRSPRTGLTALAVSPDGSEIYSGDDDGGLTTWTVARRSASRTPGEPAAAIYAVAVDPAGKWIAAGDARGAISVWDRVSRQRLAAWPAHGRGVLALAATADGRLASGGGDAAVKVWDVARHLAGPADQPSARTLEGHRQPVGAVGMLSDGRVVSGSTDGELRIWDVASGKPQLTLQGHVGAVLSIAIASTANQFATTGADGAVHLWYADFARPRRTLRGHRSQLASLAIDPAAKQLIGVSGESEQTSEVARWSLLTRDEPLPPNYLADAEFAIVGSSSFVAADAESLRLCVPLIGWESSLVERKPSTAGFAVRSARISRDGRIAVLGRDDGVEIVRLSPDGARQSSFHLQRPEPPRTMSLSDGGDWLALYEQQAGASVWDLRQDPPAEVPIPSSPTPQTQPAGRTLRAPVVSPDGRYLLGLTPSGVALVDLRDGRFVTPGKLLVSTVFAFHPSKPLVALGQSSGDVLLCSLPQLEPVMTLALTTGPVSCLEFSPDGGRLVVGHSGPQARGAIPGTGGSFGVGLAEVRIWSVAIGEPLLMLRDFVGSIRSVRFSADGNLLAVQDGNGILLLDGSPGESIVNLRDVDGPVIALKFVDGGRKLAAGIGQGFIDFDAAPGVRLWDLAAGTNTTRAAQLKSAAGESLGLIRPSFHPDGIRGASPTSDGRLALFELATGSVLAVWPAFAVPLRSAEFSPDGHMLACRLEDNVAEIWDAQTARLICRLEGALPAGGALRFSPDGGRVALQDSVGSSIGVWDSRSGKHLRQVVSPFVSLHFAVPTDDPSLLLAASRTGGLALWDLQTGTVRHQFESHPNEVSALALSPSGLRAATAGGGVVLIWDLAATRPVQRFDLRHRFGVPMTDLAFSPDGTRLAVGGNRQVVVLAIDR